MRSVACISRINLPDTYQQERIYIKTDLKTVETNLQHLEFVEKHLAEQNENYKQLIPYTILINSQNRIAIYTRKGNEQRLHGLWSAGFGGHIEDYEYTDNQPIQELILNSALRELKEEFSQETEFLLQFEGVINEEFTKVGRTHIACVFSVQVDEKLFTASDEIEEVRWIEMEELKNFKTELWTEMAIDLINLK